MNTYTARVLDVNQRVRSVRVDALSAEAASRSLAEGGQQVLSIEPAKALVLRPAAKGRFDAQLFAEELRALLQAGLEVMESLTLLARRDGEAHGSSVLETLRQSVSQGQTLGTAMEAQPHNFPALLVGLVRAAETTGSLPEALGRYAQQAQRMRALKQQLTSALVYPAILLMAGGGVGLFLLLHVVPKFAAVYGESGRPLPWASALLLDWGRWADASLGLVLTVLAVVVLALMAIVRAAMASGRLEDGLTRVPALGPRLATLAMSRTYFTLGMLVEAGIPVRGALDMAGQAASATLRQRMQQAAVQVDQGRSLSEAFEAHGLGSPIALRFLAVGEQTGQLGAMLTRAAAFHEGEAVRWIERFAKAFEPVLMLAMGVGIGGVIVLLYMPVFELAGNL